jgi:hypothetical protein
MEIKNFLTRCISFFPILFLAGYILFQTVLQQFFHNSYLFIFLYFAVITTLSGLLFMHLSIKKPDRFAFYYFAFSGAKLFLHLIVLLIFLAIYKGDAIYIGLFFFVMYLIFKGFEIFINQSFNQRLKR